jgi:hypothetical protein
MAVVEPTEVMGRHVDAMRAGDWDIGMGLLPRGRHRRLSV